MNFTEAKALVNKLLETEFNPDAVPSKENLLLMARPSECKERCQVCNEAFCSLVHRPRRQASAPDHFITLPNGKLVPGEHICQQCDEERFNHAMDMRTEDIANALQEIADHEV